MSPMTRYIFRRLQQTVVVLIAISAMSFFFIHLSGDPAALMLPQDASAADIARLREELGFNDPIWVQYGRFVWGAARGDFGQSLYYHVPVMQLVLERLPASLELAVAALTLALTIAVPIGILSAVTRGSAFDIGSMIVALLGLSMPHFWLGIMMILLFSVTLGWLPTSGRGTIYHLIMPATALGLSLLAMFARLTRSVMLEVLQLDYIRTARAKGLREVVVVGKHAFRNALIPIVTVAGLELGLLLGGTVVIETVFAWPGLGRLVVQAILNRDYPLVQAVVLVLAVIFVAVNLLVDLLYGVLDPQIKLTGERR